MLRSVKIKKDKLLKIIKKNRNDHRDVFLEAQEGYRKLVIELLEQQIALARGKSKGFNLERITSVTAPEDHTEDYDKAIKMLEMSEDKVIDLAYDSFTQLVMDDWGWGRQWAASNSAYVRSAGSVDKLSKYLNK